MMTRNGSLDVRAREQHLHESEEQEVDADHESRPHWLSPGMKGRSDARRPVIFGPARIDSTPE
jgi:hypothetical protein